MAMNLKQLQVLLLQQMLTVNTIHDFLDSCEVLSQTHSFQILVTKWRLLSSI